MTEKQIEAAKKTLPNYIGCWKDYTPEQKQLSRELMCRGMINAILIYHVKPDEQKKWSIEKHCYIPVADYVYADEYMRDYIEGSVWNEPMDKDRIKELIEEQLADYRHCQVFYAGCDSEGVSYNYCRWADDQAA